MPSSSDKRPFFGDMTVTPPAALARLAYLLKQSLET